METAMGYLTEDKGVAWFSSDEQKWRTRIEKLAKEYPDEVKIIVYPEDNDGCVNATIPAKWIRVRPPRKLNLTEEQKAKRAEQMRGMRKGTDEDNEDEAEDE